MGTIQIRSCMTQDVTVISNDFLDRFLPKANGDFIKVYLYFLRAAGTNTGALSLCSAADALNLTENDVTRALKYWANEGALTTAAAEDGELTQISFVSFCNPSFFTAQSAPVASPDEITQDRLQELSGQDDIRELVFIAEHYLGKPLTPTELRTLCYYYDGLHFTPDLIDFLIEYCVSHNHKSFRYMTQVALNWHAEGITTVHDARKSIENYHREYYDILKALGIDNHRPVEAEISLMQKWLDEWKFPMDVINEACSRTVLRTAKPSLSYADGILKRWKDKGLFTLEAIREGDRAPAAKEKTKSAGGKGRAGAFSDFSQRSYNYDTLESRLLNGDGGDNEEG